MFDSLRLHRLSSPWSSRGQNTGVGSLSLLQGIFPTQGLHPGLPHCRRILYQLSHKGSPRILEWVAYPFSSRFSQYRNWTSVFCTAGRFFTNWAIREAFSLTDSCNNDNLIISLPSFQYKWQSFLSTLDCSNDFLIYLTVFTLLLFSS